MSTTSAELALSQLAVLAQNQEIQYDDDSRLSPLMETAWQDMAESIRQSLGETELAERAQHHMALIGLYLSVQAARALKFGVKAGKGYQFQRGHEKLSVELEEPGRDATIDEYPGFIIERTQPGEIYHANLTLINDRGVFRPKGDLRIYVTGPMRYLLEKTILQVNFDKSQRLQELGSGHNSPHIRQTQSIIFHPNLLDPNQFSPRLTTAPTANRDFTPPK